MLGQGSEYWQYFQKCVLILLYLFLTIGLIITWNSPATGFEASIYQSTPLILWIGLISAVIVGISFVVLSLSTPSLKGNNLWKFGFFLIILCYTICLGLFIIRGYYEWNMNGDSANHLGWINEILTDGHIPHSTFYPIIHILLSQITLVTNLNLVFLHKIIPLIFGLLCVVFIYILAKLLTSHKIVSVLAVIFSCTLSYEWYLNLTPNHLSNLFFPLVLFLIFKYLKEKTISWTILLFIVIFLYPVFHPIPAIVLGLIFLTLWIPQKLSKMLNVIWDNRRFHLDFYKKLNFKLMIPFLVLVAWSIFWISMFSVWGVTWYSIYHTISMEGGPSKIGNLMDQVSYAQGYGYNVYEIVLKQMGGPLIIFILSVLSFALMWKKLFRERNTRCLFSLYGPFGMLCVLIPILYVLNLPFGPMRFFVYLSLLGTIFSGYFLSYLLIKSRESKTLFASVSTKLVVIVLLTGLFLLGLLNLYPSPYNMGTSYQITKSEAVGMRYFYEHRDVAIPVTGISVAPGTFAWIYLTPEEREIQRLPDRLKTGSQIPWHFGYDTYSSIAFSYEKETNLIIAQRDRVIYTKIFPKMAPYRLRDQDFKRLNEDSGISHQYSNGDIELWTIKGQKAKVIV